MNLRPLSKEDEHYDLYLQYLTGLIDWDKYCRIEKQRGFTPRFKEAESEPIIHVENM